MAFCRHGRGYPASLPAEVISAALHSCTLPKFIFLLFKGASSGLQSPHLEERLCHQSCACLVFFFTLSVGILHLTAGRGLIPQHNPTVRWRVRGGSPCPQRLGA